MNFLIIKVSFKLSKLLEVLVLLMWEVREPIQIDLCCFFRCTPRFLFVSSAFEKDGTLSSEEMEQYIVAKRKMLGNIKFIGELGKLDMLHEGILHQCIKQLLGTSVAVANSSSVRQSV